MGYTHFPSAVTSEYQRPLVFFRRTAKEEEGPAAGHERRRQEIQRVQVLEHKQQDGAPRQEVKEEGFNWGGCRLQHQSSVRPETLTVPFLKPINRR